jgi:RNA polymerase sigma-70 factor (ECF subfamily)
MATFDDVYRRHLPTVLRAAWRAVGRRDVAEEITADAFLELYRHFDRIDVAQLPGWVLTVMKNRAVDYWRRQNVERRYLSGAVEPEAPRDTRQPPMPVDLFAHPALKPIHRACLLLRYQHGLSREEIGCRLGLSATQVRGHLQYGLKLLRKHVAVAQ